jgi:hypothetical protein
MNLPDDLFKRITDSITSVVDGGDDGHPGDRRAPRLKSQAHITVFPWTHPDDEMLSVRIRDLSQGGIGILHTRRIALDEQFVVALPSGDDGQSTLVLCTVVFWEPLSEDLFAIGARFERTVEETEIVALQPEFVAETSLGAAENAGIMSRITQAVARVRRLAS